jgi:two-component sensor histidine kinase
LIAFNNMRTERIDPRMPRPAPAMFRGFLRMALLSGAVLFGTVRAQEGSVYEVPGLDMLLRVRHWNEDDGLSSRGVKMIAKDRQGFLWLATESGLERFDGYSFVYTGRAQGLRAAQVKNLAVDAGGLLWACDVDADRTVGHVDIVDPATGVVRSFESMFGEVFPHDPGGLSPFVVDPADTSIVMVHLDAGLQMRYHPRKGLRTYPWPRNGSRWITGVLDRAAVLALWPIADGSIQLVTVDTTGRIGAPLRTFAFGSSIRVLSDENEADGTVTIYPNVDSATAMLQVTHDGRISTPMNGARMPFNKLHPFAPFADGLWWCGGRLLDANGNVLLDLAEAWPGLVAGLGSLRDGDDRLWVGTEFGLFQLTITPRRFARWLDLSDSVVTNGFRTRGLLVTGHVLHVNGEREGYWRLDRRTGEVLLSDRSGIESHAIAMDQRGGIHRTEMAVLVVEHDGRTDRIPLETRAWAILPDPDGMGGWVGGEGLLQRYDVRSSTRVSGSPAVLAGALVLQLMRDNDGSFWAATDIGLFLLSSDGSPRARYWTEGEGPYHLPTDRINALRAEGDTLWVSTGGAGLLIMRPDQGIVGQYDRSSGLPSNVIYASYVDAGGALWMPTARGLARLDPSTGRVSVFTTADGLTYDEFNRISHTQGPDGTLYFGGLNGVTALDPAQIAGASPGQVPPLVITRFSKLAGADRQHVDLIPQWHERGSVEFRHDDGQIELGFALLNYEPKEQVVYEWMIEGENTSWSTLDEPYLRFGRLPYGEKVLLIRARSGRIMRQPPMLRIPVHVLRPLYLRWWAITGALVLIAGGTVLLFRARVARVRREYALRDRIAMDLHDEVGSTLSGINLTANVARKRLTSDAGQASVLLDEIAENTSTTMDAMHDIVWAINARYDDLDSMVARMRHHAGRACEVRGIQLRFHADERASKVRLSMVQRRNTYLVFKEALNNALKYAQCTLIEVDLRMDRELVLTIKDNGKGFILEEAGSTLAGGHNGLRNMHKRAHEIGGGVEIRTAPREGTQIRFRFSP